MGGLVPGLTREVPHALFSRLLRVSLRELRDAEGVRVQARPATPADPLSVIARGIITDHHTGMQPGTLGDEFA